MYDMLCSCSFKYTLKHVISLLRFHESHVSIKQATFIALLQWSNPKPNFCNRLRRNGCTSAIAGQVLDQQKFMTVMHKKCFANNQTSEKKGIKLCFQISQALTKFRIYMMNNYRVLDLLKTFRKIQVIISPAGKT